MVEMATFNVQRAITQKEGKPELQFMCSARCHIVLYICVKLRDNIINGIRVMERTRMIESADGRTDTQNIRRYNIIPSPLIVAGHKKDYTMYFLLMSSITVYNLN